MIDTTDSKIVIQRSIKNFNEQMKDQGWNLRLKEEIEMYSMRIAKKKN